MGLGFVLGKIADFWEATQVELHGFYSVERVREFIQYNQHASMFRAVAVLTLMPWPCVIITILVDVIPLRPPAEGPNANYLFMVWTFLAFWISTIAISLQFRHSVPSVGLSNVRIVVNGVFTAVFSTGVLYALSLVIGFPLPFGILTVSPAWVTFMLIPLASFVRKARLDPAVWLQIMNTLKTWVGQESLVLIYPAYFYVFTTLPTNVKTPFAMLLPIIKIFMRNVMSRTVVHLNDEIPEVVLMNVEVFNSLFMSYCMQNSPSIWTTLGLIAIDGAQMIASMYDVSDVIQRLRILKERVNAEHDRLSIDNPAGTEGIGLRRKTILVYTEDILDRYPSTQKSPAATMVTEGPTQSILPKVVHREAKVAPKSYRRIPKHILYLPSVLARSKLVKRLSMTRKVFLSRDVDDVEGKVDVTQLELEYATKVRKLLYITEFVLLINYVEVIVPIIFGTFIMDFCAEMVSDHSSNPKFAL
ncbi:hypothetical protein ON010_g15795 [Phytophthora cinnamomi]|nr:hypothetical protein ON010_g15795 [Phytophthora cinnamomi]